MLGYTFTTEQQAIDAKEQAASFLGYPKPNCVSRYWVDYQYSELDNIYYIIYDQGLEQVLGQPIEFEIQVPPQDQYL